MKTLLVLALGLSFACAGTTAASSSTPAASMQGGTCAQATVARGTVIYSRPDSAYPLTTVAGKTNVCVDQEQTALGFRHVKLGNGQDGYVADTDLG